MVSSVPVPVEVDALGTTAVIRTSEKASASATFHAMWLRDACECAKCRRPSTGERLLDSAMIPAGLTILAAAADGAGRVDFVFSDGHVSIFEATELLAHAGRASAASNAPAGGHRLWSGEHEVAVAGRSALDEVAALRIWMDSLWLDGVAVVRDVDPTKQGLLDTAGLIGHVLPSNYGVTWEIEATASPSSAVDSTWPLRVHADLPYRQTPPGIQLMLSTVNAVAGGASTFVDGFAVAESIRRSDPTAWDLLTTVEFTYPYVREHVEIRGRAPAIGLRRDGSYRIIRWAPDLVGRPLVDAERTPDLYRALRVWTDALDDETNRVEVRLEPGELVAFVNHRVLHGRTGFGLGATGRRHLLGCYLDIDELNNRRALLRRSARSPE